MTKREYDIELTNLKAVDISSLSKAEKVEYLNKLKQLKQHKQNEEGSSFRSTNMKYHNLAQTIEANASLAASTASFAPIKVREELSLISSAGAANGRGYSGIETGRFDLPGVSQLNLLDLVQVINTNADSIRYGQVSGIPANATIHANATTVSGTAEKALLTPVYAEKTILLNATSSWVPMSRNMFRNSEQAVGIAERQLEVQVRKAFTGFMFTGSIASQGWDGLDNAGVQTQSFASNNYRTVLEAIAKVQAAEDGIGGYNPNGIVMHPTTWAALQGAATTASGGALILTSIAQNPWGIPVITSNAVATGVAYVGDWSTLVVYQNQGFDISISESHSDYFAKNLVAMRGEMYAALAVPFPYAFCKATLSI